MLCKCYAQKEEYTEIKRLTFVFFFSLLSVKAEVKIPRLSPLPVHEKRVELSGDWFLFPLATTNLSSFHVKTTFDKDYKNANLIAQVEIANENL